MIRFIILMILFNELATAQPTPDDFIRADSLITRLPPSAFPQLPNRIRKTLEQGGFTIPQSFADSLPHNVIVGEFRKHGQQDWAVLASKNRVSSILVFWNGSAKDTTQFKREPDSNYLQDMGTGILFSRVIRGRKLNIETDCIEYDNEEKPRVIDHDALEEGFLGKGSDAFYFYNEKWFSCATGD